MSFLEWVRLPNNFQLYPEENLRVSDIKLFSINGQSAQELEAKTAVLEKDLQNHIERHMEVLLGVRFLATEYSTGKTHKGRIDSLGLDENGCPVIVEYKRHTNENVINQRLFYLDLFLDHQDLILQSYEAS